MASLAPDPTVSPPQKLEEKLQAQADYEEIKTELR